MRDAAGRHDTQNQRYAKVRSAEKRQCPECKRKAAMVKVPVPRFGPLDPVRAYCRWCGYKRERTSATPPRQSLRTESNVSEEENHG